MAAFLALFLAAALVYEVTDRCMVPCDPIQPGEAVHSAPSVTSLRDWVVGFTFLASCAAPLIGLIATTRSRLPRRTPTLAVTVPLTLLPIVYWVGIVAFDWPAV